MRFDPQDPRTRTIKGLLFLKGRCSISVPSGLEADSSTLNSYSNFRTLESDIEGHPTPWCPYVDGHRFQEQGFSVGIGIVVNNTFQDKTAARIYVMMEEGETIEGPGEKRPIRHSFFN